MKSPERIAQLALGETVTTIGKKSTGVIPPYQFVLVPTRKGHCSAKLMAATNVEKIEGLRVSRLPAFKIETDVQVGKNIRGDWKFWNVPAGSVIGAHSKQVNKRGEKEKFTTRKDPAFS